MFKSYLEEAVSHQKFIGIRQTTDPDQFSAGYLVGLTESHYALRRVDTLGEADGFDIGLIDAIQGLTVSGDYLDFLEWASAQRIDQMTFELPYDECEIRAVLQRAMQLQRAVSLIDRSDALGSGFVVSLEEATVVMDARVSDGSSRGIEALALADVQRVIVDSSAERQLERYRDYLARRP